MSGVVADCEVHRARGKVEVKINRLGERSSCRSQIPCAQDQTCLAQHLIKSKISVLRQKFECNGFDSSMIQNQTNAKRTVAYFCC